MEHTSYNVSDIVSNNITVSYISSTKLKFICGESCSVENYPHLVTVIMVGEKCLVSDNLTGKVFTVDYNKLTTPNPDN